MTSAPADLSPPQPHGREQPTPGAVPAPDANAAGGVVIVGATSSIARAIADRFARQGRRVILAARDAEEADRLATDLSVRHRVQAFGIALNAADDTAHAAFFHRCEQLCRGPFDGIVLAHGFMAAQGEARADSALARRMIEANYTSFVTLLGAAADRVRAPGGFLCAISSVAGDRGRPSNYIYGSTKAALDAYLDGLRAEQFKRGVSVTAVKPGFVDTAMTWGLPGMFLVATPDLVARDVERAITRRRAVVYSPWFWRWIMTIIRWIPRPIFNRMKL